MKNVHLFISLILMGTLLSSSSYAMEEKEEKKVVTPTVYKVNNPELFESELCDLEARMKTLIPESIVRFTDYIDSGRLGVNKPKGWRHDLKTYFTIGLFHNGINEDYAKCLLKTYDLNIRPHGIEAVCAENAAYKMSKILGLNRLVPPNYVAFNKAFSEQPTQSYSIQFLVEDNNSDNDNIITNLEKLSLEDRSHLFLFRFCLGSVDHNNYNVLFHRVKGEIKPILIDFEDIYNVKRREESKDIIKKWCKDKLFTNKSVNLYKNITIDQFKEGFSEGIKYAPHIYKDAFFTHLYTWKEDFLKWIEEENKIIFPS